MLNKDTDMKVAVAVTRYMGVSDGEQLSQDKEVGALLDIIPERVENLISIGTGVDISIKELAETNQRVVGYNGEIKFNTDKPYERIVKLTDPSKLHELGWKHSVELTESIGRVYEGYLKNL